MANSAFLSARVHPLALKSIITGAVKVQRVPENVLGIITRNHHFEVSFSSYILYQKRDIDFRALKKSWLAFLVLTKNLKINVYQS